MDKISMGKGGRICETGKLKAGEYQFPWPRCRQGNQRKDEDETYGGRQSNQLSVRDGGSFGTEFGDPSLGSAGPA